MPDKKLDAPDEVAFAKEISKHLPGPKEHRNLVYELGAAFILGKVIKSVSKRK